MRKEQDLAVTDEQIVYEQPLNEQMRTCLRFEHLLHQADYHLKKDSSWDTRCVIRALFDVLSVIDRADLKSRLGQTINQYLTTLVQMEKLPGINKQQLEIMVEYLKQAMEMLHDIQGKIGQELRNNEFLAAIYQRYSVPAGTSEFTLPAFHLWLQQPLAVRLKDLVPWRDSFAGLQKIIDLLLQLTRESTELRPKIAKGGFYQINLDSSIPYQMVRIALPIKENLYPEISVGRHLLTIHFFEFNPYHKANQTKKDVAFTLACCKLYTKEEPIPLSA